MELRIGTKKVLFVSRTSDASILIVVDGQRGEEVNVSPTTKDGISARNRP